MRKKQLIAAILLSFISYSALSDDLSKGHPSTSHYSKTIPFELINNAIFITLTIEGENYRFMLDTGSPTLLSPKVISNLKLERTNNSFHYTDANGRLGNIDTFYLPDLNIGPVTYTGYTASAFDGLDKQPFSCYKADGVLGYNILKDSVVLIDFVENEVTISDSIPPYIGNLGYVPVGFLFNGHGAPILNAWHDFGNIEVLLDTGSNTGLNLQAPELQAAIDELGYEGHQIKGGITQYAAAGAKNRGNSKLYYLNNLRFGRLKMSNTPTVIGPDNTASLMGIELLKQYNVIIDFKSSIAWFKSNGPSSASEVIPRFGIYLNESSGSLVVDAVLEGSEADTAGVLPGDEIIEVNGEKVDLSNQKEYCKLVKSSKSSHFSYLVKLKNNTTVSF